MQDPETIYVQQVQAGDDDAFNELLRRYQKPVLNFAYRLLGDATEAEDVAQETFVRAYRHIGDYDSRQKFSTWLFAIAHHACLDHLRSRKRRPEISLENAPDPSITSREVERNEMGMLIAAAVAKLPEDQRTALVLAEYHGMSYAEIAAVMRCSEKSVESRLYRAKQTLRGRLRPLLA